MKICSKCKRNLDASCFGKHRGHTDGLQTVCKECKNSARRKGPKPIVTDDQMRSRYRKMRVNGKQVSVHRYVAEQMIGRPLKSNEVVHHINGNRYDNRPENLEVLEIGEHSRLTNVGRKWPIEVRRKVSASLIGNQRRKGIPHSTEIRERISQSVKEVRRRKFWSSRPKSDN